ncbi:MAG: hypothetical protein Q9201_007470 [Fulgogasparrea decipioides]
MSAAKDEPQELAAMNNARQGSVTAPTVVVVSSSTAAENIVAGLSAVTESAAESPESIDAIDLTSDQWTKILNSSSVLKAWKGQHEGGRLHVNRAPCAGKPSRQPIEGFELTASALALKRKGSNSDDRQQDMPEFEVSDDTYVETRESKSNLEREMTLKAFTASGIHSTLGTILPCRVTLGGRLCTTQEVHTEDRTQIFELKKHLESQLTATVKGAGVGVDNSVTRQRRSERREHQYQVGETSRMIVETQGGNGLLASSIPDWTGSVASFRYWRPIQQDKPESLLRFLAQTAKDTSTRDQINALVQQATKQQRQRPRFLDISIETSGPVVIQPEKSEHQTRFIPQRQIPVVFRIRMHISQPSVIKFLSFNRIVTKDRFGSISVTRIHTLERTDIREQIAFDVRSEVLEGTWSQSEKGRLPEAFNIDIAVSLEPFMRWGKEAHPYLMHESGDHLAVLKWPDIEVNSTMHWNLPVTRDLQQSGSQGGVLDSTRDKEVPKLTALANEQTELQERKAASGSEPKSRSLFHRS